MSEERRSYWKKQIQTRDPEEIATILAEMEARATRDQLTGLPNETEFRDRFAEFSGGAFRRGSRVFVAFLDFDDLKKRKFKAIHSNEVGNTKATDGQQFIYAKKHSMILMTNDFDFVSFHKQYNLSKNSGIVIFNQAQPHITNKLINKLIKHIEKTNIQLCEHITSVSTTQIVQHK